MSKEARYMHSCDDCNYHWEDPYEISDCDCCGFEIWGEDLDQHELILSELFPKVTL